MNTQERRQEILKAEETIRQLASEMGRASESAAQAEAAINSLNEARATLEKTERELKKSINQARISLEVASNHVLENGDRSKELISEAIEEAATDLLNASILFERLETHIIDAVNDFKIDSQNINYLKKEISRIDLRLKWVIIFSAMAAGGALASIILQII